MLPCVDVDEVDVLQFEKILKTEEEAVEVVAGAAVAVEVLKRLNIELLAAGATVGVAEVDTGRRGLSPISWSPGSSLLVEYVSVVSPATE